MAFFDITLYIKVYKNKFVVRHIENGKTVTIPAAKPFTSNRLLVGNFTNATATLQNGIKQQFNFKWFTASPMILIHACEMAEDGLSEVEARAIHELAADAGARQVFVWDGRELLDNEVIEKFKNNQQ